MATPKTWTADDIEQGKLTIHRITHPDTDQPALQIERRYIFLDDQDEKLQGVAGGRVLEIVEIGNLPQGIIDALQAIDNWTYQQALSQEGML